MQFVRGVGRTRVSAVHAGLRPAHQSQTAAGRIGDAAMLNLAEYRQRPALLADWLPWAGLIAPGVVLNKDGSFQRTARFRGPDLDSATQGELIATSARLNNALRRLGSGWALFLEPRARPAAVHPHS